MKKIAFTIMFYMFLSKVLGFIKDIIFAYFYGTTYIADAFIISITIPTTIFALIGAAIRAAYIPIYQEAEESEGEISSISFTNNLINILFLFSAITALTTLIFPEVILRIFASGFDNSTMQLAVKFTRITILSIFATTYIHVISGYLHLRNSFKAPALISIPLNILLIVSIVMSAGENNNILIVGYLVATFSQILFIFPFAKAKGFKHKLVFDIKDKHLKKFMLLALPIFLSASISDINKIVDKTIASNMLTGTISALNYSSKLTLFIQSVFVIPVTTALFPLITKMASETNLSKYKALIIEASNIVVIIITPITIGAMYFSTEIVSVLYGRGAFGQEAIVLTSGALFYYSMGMVFRGIEQTYTRAFYAIHNTRTPMQISIFAIFLNIVLNLFFYLFTNMGAGGLALATSLTTMTSSIILIILFRKRVGSLGLRAFFKTTLKVLLASSLMMYFTSYVYKYLNSIFLVYYSDTLLSTLSSLIIAISFGAIVYIFILIVFRVDDIIQVLNKIKTVFQRRT
jgi:putative peptidoglycan lipid II flippase